MSRKWALLLVLMLISATFTILIPIHSSATEPTRVYVDPPSIIDPPTFFNVSVKVDNVQGLVGAELKLYWDPALLYAVNMTEVMFHEVTPQTEWDNIWQIENVIDNVAGYSYYTYTFVQIVRALNGGYAPISGNFTIFVMSFQVKGVGNCTLHFDTSKLGEDLAMPIVHDTIDGFFSNSIPPPPIPLPPGEPVQVLFQVNPRAVKNESLTINSIFSVSIELDCLDNNSGFAAYNFVLLWNSTLLRFVGVADVVFHEVVGQTDWSRITTYVNAWPPGDLGCVGSLPDGYGAVFGNHTAAVVTFQVLGVGKCPLSLGARATNLTANNLISTSKSGYFSNAMSGDLNGDGRVDLFDALLLAKSYGSTPDLPSWNEDADINGDGVIDIYDALLLCRSFGRTV